MMEPKSHQGKIKILITGAVGFIGQHLLEELKQDNFSIRILARSQPTEFWTTNTDFETYVADISDKSALEKAFTDVSIVINLAAEKNDLKKFNLTNIEGVQNIIELCEKYNIKKIIHLSSISVFGMKYSRKKVRVGENFLCNPHTPYGVTKLRSEVLLQEFGKKSKTEIIILRSTPVFGEHQSTNYLLDLLKRVKSGVSIPRHKNTIANYVYVKDIAHAVRFFLLNDVGSKTITVGESVSFQEFVTTVSEIFNVSCKINKIPSFLFGLLEIVNYFGLQNLKEKFRSISNRVEYDDTYMKNSITYKYGLSQGIKNTIKHYKL